MPSPFQKRTLEISSIPDTPDRPVQKLYSASDTLAPKLRKFRASNAPGARYRQYAPFRNEAIQETEPDPAPAHPRAPPKPRIPSAAPSFRSTPYPDPAHGMEDRPSPEPARHPR